jgi:hypothetical protein
MYALWTPAWVTISSNPGTVHALLSVDADDDDQMWF